MNKHDQEEGPQGPIHHHRQPGWWVEGALATLLIAIAIFADAIAHWVGS